MTISRKRIDEIEAIDDRDIPETDAAFWAGAELVEPDRAHTIDGRATKPMN